MTITITAINATFGAVVTDVDLAKLGDETWSEIHTAFLEYGVLVFPGQHLDDEAQGAFASRFGNIEQFSPQQTGSNIHISNQKPDGSLAQPDEQQFHILRGNEGWHTDSTYMPLASKAALLAAMVLPPEGGETDFADMQPPGMNSTRKHKPGWKNFQRIIHCITHKSRQVITTRPITCTAFTTRVRPFAQSLRHTRIPAASQSTQDGMPMGFRG